MSDFIFCKIMAGRIAPTKVHEDEPSLAFMDIGPVNPGRRAISQVNTGKSKGADPDGSHQRTLNTSLPRRWRPSLTLWAAAASDKA